MYTLQATQPLRVGPGHSTLISVHLDVEVCQQDQPVYLSSIFPWWTLPWKHHKYPCLCIFPHQFGSIFDTLIHNSIVFYVKIAVNLHLKCLDSPDCWYMENIFIDFIGIYIYIYDKCRSMQTIPHQIKRAMPQWKILKCPQYIPEVNLVAKNDIIT